MINIYILFLFLMKRRPPRSTQSRSSAASDVYKRQVVCPDGRQFPGIEAEQLSAVRYQPFQAGEQVLLPGHLPGPGDAAFDELKPENQGRAMSASSITARSLLTVSCVSVKNPRVDTGFALRSAAGVSRHNPLARRGMAMK